MEKINLKILLQKVKEARETFLAECKKDYDRKTHFVSRGTWFNSCSDKEGQVFPFIGAEAIPFKGTLKQLKRAIAQCEAEPKCDSLAIEGGFDAYESFFEYTHGGDYDPWSGGGSWEVEVWTRKNGILKDILVP